MYVNGVPYVSADEYYQQTVALANEGADITPDDPNAEELWTQNTAQQETAQSDDNDPANQWMPLGTFAVLSDPKQTSSHLVMQLAMNKKGVIRGNIYNQVTDKVQQLEGAVDNQTQRVAFRITGDKDNTIECGLWNLTQESLPILVHEGKDKTLTRTLIRLSDPKDEAPKSEVSKEETPKSETPKAEVSKEEAPQDETPKAEVSKDETPKDEAPKEKQ